MNTLLKKQPDGLLHANTCAHLVQGIEWQLTVSPGAAALCKSKELATCLLTLVKQVFS